MRKVMARIVADERAGLGPGQEGAIVDALGRVLETCVMRYPQSTKITQPSSASTDAASATREGKRAVGGGHCGQRVHSMVENPSFDRATFGRRLDPDRPEPNVSHAKRYCLGDVDMRSNPLTRRNHVTGA